MSGERVAYRDAAAAARRAFRLAREQRCSLEEHAVLEAVVSRTALYSKLDDRVAVAEIAAAASVHPKNASAALRSLRDKGILDYEPGRGAGNLSRVGLPGKGAAQAPFVPVEKGSRSGPKKGADQTPKREPSTRARPNGTEKTSEKTPEKKGIYTADVLAIFNEVAGASFTADGWLAKIAERMREHPELSIEEHRQIIERNLAAPWWDTISPSVIYGSAAQFERAMHSNGLRTPRTLAERKSARIRALLGDG